MAEYITESTVPGQGLATAVEQKQVSAQGELNFFDLLNSISMWGRYLIRKWLALVLAGIAGALAGFLLAFAAPVTYSSQITFILEEGKSSGSGLSAIAGQFGFELGSLSNTSSLLAGDNIIGLLKSRKFVKQTLLTPYDESGKISLADRYAEVSKLKAMWTKEDLGITSFPPTLEPSGYTRLQDSLLQVITNTVILKELYVQRSDKKMSFFEMGATFKDEKLTKLFSERLLSSAVDFYVETKTRRSRSNVARLQHRADSIGSLLNSRTYSAAAAQSRALDINPAYQTAAVGVELSAREKTVTGTIYAEIIKNLEIQKATLTQETPIIQIVDSAELPLKKNKPRKIVYVVTGFIIAVLLLSLYFFARVFMNARRNNRHRPVTG